MKSAPTSRSVAALCGLALVAGCSCGGASFGGPPEGTPTELVPPAGPMTGILAKDLRVFLGVPYAAPPIGPNRFRPPVRAAHFDTPFDASKYGKVCPQLPRHDHGAPIEDDLEVEGDEDCLNLNVWAHADEKKRPVMVFIHGGGFQQGTGSKPYYEGSTLAREGDVVVVTINYRLGVLGLLASEELAAESPDHAAGNYAILDQIAALEWVRDNIEALVRADRFSARARALSPRHRPERRGVRRSARPAGGLASRTTVGRRPREGDRRGRRLHG